MRGPSRGCSPAFDKHGSASPSCSLTLCLHGETSRERPSRTGQTAACLLESEGPGAGHEMRRRGGTRVSAHPRLASCSP